MGIFTSEFLGSFFLILFGSGVVANVVLKGTKGNHSGWIVITLGWAMAVFMGVSVATFSGAHLNPAVTIALFIKGNIPFESLLPYIGGQLSGCFVGAAVVWLVYRDHFNATDDADLKLAVFSTSPAIRNSMSNLLSEVIGTFSLVAAILFLPNTTTDLGHLKPLPVALIVLGIGLSLGGTTGYAINPARDLGPRLAHALLPIRGKRDSDWSYAWIPIIGPILGGILAVLFYQNLQP